MDASLSQLAMKISGIDITVSSGKVTELSVHHKIPSDARTEGGQPIGFISSGKTFEQLLEELEIYHECVSVANAQLRQKMKAPIGTEGQFMPTKRQEDIEIFTTAIILAYNNMVGAIFYRTQKLKTKPTDDISFSTQYSRIVKNAIQSSIEVTNQLLNFSLFIRS